MSCRKLSRIELNEEAEVENDGGEDTHPYLSCDCCDRRMLQCVPADVQRAFRIILLVIVMSFVHVSIVDD